MIERIEFSKISFGSCKFMQLTIFRCVVNPYIDSIVYHLVSHSFNLNVTLFTINLQHSIV